MDGVAALATDAAAFLVAAAVAAVATPATMRLAVAVGALSRPGGRHAHERATPRLGGLAVAAGAVAGACFAAWAAPERIAALIADRSLAAFAAGSFVIAAAGFVDDRRPLRPALKLAAQLVAALFAVAAGFDVTAVTNPLTGGELALGAFGSACVVAWIVLVVNALNVVDGLDGLASGLAAIAAATMFAVASIKGQTETALAAAVLGGAAAGFLPFNRHPARVFLGDTGSMLLGYWLALLSVQGALKGPTLVLTVVPMFALGLPILDAAVSFLRRALVAGLAAVVRADREHIHHRMLANGFTHARAVTVLHGVAIASGLLGVVTSLVHAPIVAAVVVAAAALAVVGLRWLGYGARRAVASDSVAVVVLGDLARSPRMVQHALALAAEGRAVDLVGYVESALPPSVQAEPKIRCHTLDDDRKVTAWGLAGAASRLVRQTQALAACLRSLDPAPSLVLVQTPPALPTLWVAWRAARRARARLAIDWHNFGYSMLALRLGPRHPVVVLAGAVEMALGRRADVALCVSRAMQQALRERWRIDATVVYDRPAPRFRRLSEAERQRTRQRLASLVGASDPSARDHERPAIVVTSTSWTADEDLLALCDAAALYDDACARASASLPRLVVVATGRGPLRAEFEERARGLALAHVDVRTAWLEEDDYALLLGAADLGVSLHRSSSGVDLPMKVFDMLGAGLPVCMLEYGPCVREAIDEGSGGAFFTDAAGLASRWTELLRDFPSPSCPLSRLRARLADTPPERWSAEWQRRARPLLIGEP